MEKYTKWRDPATGIHPFLPITGNANYDSSLSRILSGLRKVTLGPVLALVRLLLVVVVFVGMVLFTFIFDLIPIAFVKRFFKSTLQLIGARVLLFFMGFHWIETKYLPLSRKRGDTYKGTPGSNIKSGDVIIANITSYVDILYLTFRFAPYFATVPNTWTEAPPRGIVVPKGSFWSAISDVISFPVHPVSEGKSIKEVADKARRSGNGPLVVFPEGTTSNGRAVLEGVPVLANADVDPSRVHVIGFRYTEGDMAPYTIGSSLWHLLRLLSQVHNSMQVRYMTAGDMPTLPLDASERTPVDKDKEEWADALYKNLPSILQLRKSTLSAMDKREFVKYWYSHKKSYKGK